jgi:ribosomal protein L11 methyltransferase (prmA)
MQYFDNNENLISKKREISVLLNDTKYTFISDNGVFSKGEVDYGSIALLKILLKQNFTGNILDIGCGYGTIGLILAKNFPECNFLLSDVNIRACALARENKKSFGVKNVEIIESDIFQNIDKNFDYIVTNPPIRAGKKVIYSIFEQSYHHLNQNGSLFIVIRRSHGAESAQKFIHSVFENCELLKKDKGFYVYCATKKDTKTKEDF